MPGRDATGPQGQGAGTGWGLGNCRSGQGRTAPQGQGMRRNMRSGFDIRQGQGAGQGLRCRRRGTDRGFSPRGRGFNRFNR